MGDFFDEKTARARITVAAFYVSLAEATARRIQDAFSSVTVHQPLDLLEASLASARRVMPTCHTVILTDEQTVVPSHLDAQVVRYTIRAEQLMQSRMVVWERYLQTTANHVVFTDLDVLIQRDLSALFDEEFDVALTYRPEDHWPINAGVTLFHARRLLRGMSFLKRCTDVYRSAFSAAAEWGGDQDVLREMVRGVDFDREDSFTHRIGGYDILFLPCAAYNFSTVDEDMGGDYPDKAILHYKGRRKQAMLPAWRRIQAAEGTAQGPKEVKPDLSRPLPD
ncbi:MAG: hypothetical protein IT323_16885 [Anaerolineae bacterium]|nr:hypothetical protein [Anaerolineae bacterium]